MKKTMLFSALATAFLLSAAPAHALLLTPGTASYTGNDLTPANPVSAAGERGYVETLFGTSNLTLYYKAEAGGGEDGTFASSYDATITPQNDPANALINYVSGAAISCPECYLAVKDGKHNPSYYFFDLANWNGMESLDLQNFWPAKGSISHVSIWGAAGSQVPEPASSALLGLSLAALATMRRRRAA